MKTILSITSLALLLSLNTWAMEAVYQPKKNVDPKDLQISCAFDFVRGSADSNKVFVPKKVDLQLATREDQKLFIYTMQDPASGLYGQILTHALGTDFVPDFVYGWGTIYFFQRNAKGETTTLGYTKIQHMIDAGGGNFILVHPYHMKRSQVFAYSLKGYAAVKKYGGIPASGIQDADPVKKISEAIAKATKDGFVAEGEAIGVGVESCKSVVKK